MKKHRLKFLPLKRIFCGKEIIIVYTTVKYLNQATELKIKEFLLAKLTK